MGDMEHAPAALGYRLPPVAEAIRLRQVDSPDLITVCIATGAHLPLRSLVPLRSSGGRSRTRSWYVVPQWGPCTALEAVAISLLWCLQRTLVHSSDNPVSWALLGKPGNSRGDALGCQLRHKLLWLPRCLPCIELEAGSEDAFAESLRLRHVPCPLCLCRMGTAIPAVVRAARGIQGCARVLCSDVSELAYCSRRTQVTVGRKDHLRAATNFLERQCKERTTFPFDLDRVELEAEQLLAEYYEAVQVVNHDDSGALETMVLR